MDDVVRDRMTAFFEGEVVVFLIGMRINRAWKVHRWLPVARAMPRMVRELSANPSLGFLHAHAWFGNPTIMVQYWRSFEDLERYAKARDRSHLPAWSAFNRLVGSSGDVGIWHETYRIGPGQYECVYHNMPAFGLARATSSIPATGPRETATGRMRETSPPARSPKGLDSPGAGA
jgi:hypothetical protein